MDRSMKAAVLYGARDLRIENYPRPEAPSPGMVLLRSRLVGICGSDLHYYEHGFCAAFVPDRPFILGHEALAEVAAIGQGVEGLRTGQRVAVNPARCCGFCDACKAGRINLCRKTIMLGSASTAPPTNGALAEFVTVRADQCHPLPDTMEDSVAALMEPFAVALHAVKRAGAIAGKRALVTGAGTIGQLVALAAKAYGAVPVAISDTVAVRRAKALEVGADAALDPLAADLAEQVRTLAGEGFDVIFEASGAPAALRSAFDLVRRGGTIVQIGTLGTEDVPLPANQLMNKEISLVGSMRYGNVFGEAIRLVAAGRVDLRRVAVRVFPLEEAALAFACASDRTQAVKVQIAV